MAAICQAKHHGKEDPIAIYYRKCKVSLTCVVDKTLWVTRISNFNWVDNLLEIFSLKLCFSAHQIGSGFPLYDPFEIIRIYHECERGIEISVSRITDWHQEACRAITNADHMGWIFRFHPHTNYGFFFLLTNTLFYIGNREKASIKSLICCDATYM